MIDDVCAFLYTIMPSYVVFSTLISSLTIVVLSLSSPHLHCIPHSLFLAAPYAHVSMSYRPDSPRRRLIITHHYRMTTLEKRKCDRGEDLMGGARTTRSATLT